MNRRTWILGLLTAPIGAFILTEQKTNAIDWRANYPYFIVEVKAWVDEDGKKGHETIPQVAVDGDPHYNWVTAPFFFKLGEFHALTAIPELEGKSFVFWQSEKTMMIQRNPRLDFNNESDTWWANYY